MKQIEGARHLIQQLATQGIRDFVLCAGARNAPLVKVLGAASGLQVVSFFDERAAAFFALGRVRSNGRPVAVVTTSGTAVAELLPATVEAWYSRLPLVLVTADRPAEYRETGAPQAIEQVGIFSHYVAQSYDLSGTDIPEVAVSAVAPTHINVAFEEPLIDSEVSPWACAVKEYHAEAKATQGVEASDFSRWQATTESFFKTVRSPLIMVGDLSEGERAPVRSALLNLRWPMLLEGPSGLREEKSLADFRLEGGDGIFQGPELNQAFDGVIRIGGIPTTRLWRDLEQLRPWPVLSFSSRPFSGLGRKVNQPLPLKALELLREPASRGTTEAAGQWLRRSQSLVARLDHLLAQDPHAEPSVFRDLSGLIPPQAHLFLGSSLPIREWDLAARYREANAVPMANRGANGIDGVMSSFLGSLSAEKENWLVLGDLSALYDLNAPWALRYSGQTPVRIVVINNQGGQIFRRLFHDPLFENQHRLGFEGWAEMWGLDYYLWRRVPERPPPMARHALIEIRPNEEATARFWEHYQALCKALPCTL